MHIHHCLLQLARDAQMCLTPLLWVHSRTGCARGGPWWSSGWGIWRSPPQTCSPSYPACWQISARLLSAGPAWEEGEQWNHNVLLPGTSSQCGCVWEGQRKNQQPWQTQSRVRQWERYLMSQHPVELLLRDGQPLSVRAVHHQDDELHCGMQKSHWVSAFQKTFTAMKCNTGGGGGGAQFQAQSLTMDTDDCYANSPFTMTEGDLAWQRTKATSILWRERRHFDHGSGRRHFLFYGETSGNQLSNMNVTQIPTRDSGTEGVNTGYYSNCRATGNSHRKSFVVDVYGFWTSHS